MGVTFKQAQAPVSESTSKGADRPSATDMSAEVEPAISIHEEVRGVPYSAKYFELESMWNKESLGMSDEFKSIDKYFRDGVESGKYEDDPAVFKKIITEALKATKSELSPKTLQVERVAKWLKFMGEL